MILHLQLVTSPMSDKYVTQTKLYKLFENIKSVLNLSIPSFRMNILDILNTRWRGAFSRGRSAYVTFPVTISGCHIEAINTPITSCYTLFMTSNAQVRAYFVIYGLQ